MGPPSYARGAHSALTQHAWRRSARRIRGGSAAHCSGARRILPRGARFPRCGLLCSCVSSVSLERASAAAAAALPCACVARCCRALPLRVTSCARRAADREGGGESQTRQRSGGPYRHGRRCAGHTAQRTKHQNGGHDTHETTNNSGGSDEASLCALRRGGATSCDPEGVVPRSASHRRVVYERRERCDARPRMCAGACEGAGGRQATVVCCCLRVFLPPLVLLRLQSCPPSPLRLQPIAHRAAATAQRGAGAVTDAALCAACVQRPRC